MNKIFNYLALLSILLLMSCSDLKKGLGFEKDVPDEFLVKKNNSIVKPPSYELLPPNSKNNDNNTADIKNSKNNDDLKTIFNNSLNSEKNIQSQKIQGNSSQDTEDLFLKKIISK